MAWDDLPREKESWDGVGITRIECWWYWDGEVGYKCRKLGEQWECRKIRVRKWNWESVLVLVCEEVGLDMRWM